MSTADALAAARERDLDLVEVAPGAVPPVCRLIDYGKYMYDQAKRERSSRTPHHGELREVRFKVKIGNHDMELKLRRAERFLTEGDKVKLSVMFRGREITHPELGRSLLTRAQEYLNELAVVEKPATMEGRFMNMILGPARTRTQPPREKKKAEPPAVRITAPGANRSWRAQATVMPTRKSTKSRTRASCSAGVSPRMKPSKPSTPRTMPVSSTAT